MERKTNRNKHVVANSDKGFIAVGRSKKRWNFGLGDVELQPEIAAKITRLKLKIDAPDHTVRPEHPSPGAGTHSSRAMM